MRIMLNAAFLAGLTIPAAGLAAPAFAADLDYEYAPRPVHILPPPPPPCGVYRPCLPPPPRFGYLPPRPYHRYSYVERDYYAPRREGYGFDYDRERYELAHRHYERYGYEHPRVDPYTAHLYERREHTERSERFESGRPFADPLGHMDRRHDERFGDRDRDDDRGPGPRFRGDRDPYDHG